MAYIPTLRILKEGGHEGGDSMIPLGQPAPWDQDVEERVTTAIRRVMKSIGREPVKR
jgi:hypothetical protein